MPDVHERPADAAQTFEPLRKHLMSIAYRMLGSVSEAEDIVQDAYLRWHGTEREGVHNPRAFLTKTVVHGCLDHLKSARAQRERYVGAWLPEPLLTDPFPVGMDDSESHAADVQPALLLALERLSPLERAAFLLHDIFEMEFAEIADMLGRTVTACRQLAVRARRNLQAAQPRYTVSQTEGQRIADAFFDASRSGDLATLQSLLAETVVIYMDGGGRAKATLNPIHGRDRVLRLFSALARKAGHALPPLLYQGRINGLPGFVSVENGPILQTTAVEIRDGLITALYIVRNPDKLAHLRARLSET